MADKQYDVSHEVRRLFYEKEKIREALRREVWKRNTNPHLPPGSLYDIALVKYHAMLHHRSDHYYANARNTKIFLAALVLPFVGITCLLKWSKDSKESLIASNQLAYKDRKFKTLY